MVLAVVLPLVFPDGAPERGCRAVVAAAGRPRPRPVRRDDARACRPSSTTAWPGSTTRSASPPRCGRSPRPPRWWSSPSASRAWSRASCRSPRRWRHGTPLVRQQVGWFALGLARRARSASALLASRRARRAGLRARRGRPPGRGRASPSCSTGSTRSTCWSTARCSTPLLTVRRRRASTCSSSPASGAMLQRARRRLAALAGHRRRRRRVPAAARGDPGRGQPADLRRVERPAGADPLAAHPARAGGLARPRAARRPVAAVAVVPAAGLPVRGDGRRRPSWPSVGAAPAGRVRRLPLVHAGTTVGELAVGGGRRRRRDDAGARRTGRRARAGGPGGPPARRPRSAPASGSSSPARRSAGGCAATCTTASDPRWPGSPSSSTRPATGWATTRCCARCAATCRPTIADVRRLVDGLRPVALDELGLTEALRRLVDGVPAGGPGRAPGRRRRRAPPPPRSRSRPTGSCRRR